MPYFPRKWAIWSRRFYSDGERKNPLEIREENFHLFFFLLHWNEFLYFFSLVSWLFTHLVCHLSYWINIRLILRYFKYNNSCMWILSGNVMLFLKISIFHCQVHYSQQISLNNFIFYSKFNENILCHSRCNL